ncbi:hypothetical protein QZH41_001516 [Actinostola sp. cb2023]|nr:hypothetical protein QZH41_001516 [Actinostola sp. cb2023]
MKDMVLLPPTSSPSAANGSRLQCVGEVVTTIKIGHVTRPSVRVLVVDKLNSPAILGVDVLRNYDNMTIDWKAQVLHLGGYSIPLEDRLLGAPRQPTEDTIFVPYQDKMAKQNVLLGAGVVVRSIKNEIPILVMNNSASPIKLYNGTSIGHLSTVTVQDEEEETKRPKVTERREPANVDLSDSCLTAKQKEAVTRVLTDFRDTFANDVTEVGKTDRINFEIDTNNHPPVALKLRRTPFALRDEVDRQIREMEERGVIRESASPWSSPILLVPKKDGSYRFCADFRALNDVTVTDIFPLPSIRECLDSLGGSAMFSTLDLHSGYWQIPIDPKDRHKTAFTTESGHWEFVVMPFGVKNAPAVFSRLMADVMRGLTWNGVAIYLDDIIIGGASFDEHLRLLKEVLSRLRNAGLTIKSSKVHLCQKTLRFLGHLVSVEGISPDPEKVETVRNWPRPQTSKDVRSFLGLCNYYMEFVPNIQLLAKPLNVLTGKASFVWTAEREKSFCKLKIALTSAPVLAFPDMTKTFELSTDASDTGFGCILSQRDNSGRERPVYYLSKAFCDNELSWHTRDKEAFALVYALRKFRQYLLGRKFIWYTDHLGLRWLRNKGTPEADSLVPDVLQLKHDEAGHMSSSKTRKLIQREYYWLSVNEDTRRYCQTCSVCATCKDPLRETTTDANLTSQPTEPWQEVSMDLKGPFGTQSTSRGNRYLLVVLDLLTRAAEMIPIPNKTAKTVASAVVTEVFCRHGIPESILTDKGLEFDSSAMLVLATELGIDKKRISALHPQANGAVERLNRTIGQMLKKTQEENDLDWDLKIPFVRFNYLNQEHSSTGFIRHHDQLRYLHSRPLHLTKPSQADVTDDKPVHDTQPSGVPKKPTTSTNTVPPSTSLPIFGDSDDESDEDSDNGEGEPQENGEAPGGSTEPETARRSQRQRREPQRFGEGKNQKSKMTKGEAFRADYGELAILRSFFNEGTPVAALAGTADASTISKVKQLLVLKNPLEVRISPNRANIRISVMKAKKEHIMKNLDWLVKTVKVQITKY